MSLIMCHFFLTLMPPLNGFAEFPATLISDIYYTYNIYTVYLIVGWPSPMQNPGYATVSVSYIIK